MGQELTVAQNNTVAMYRASTDAAALCKEIVVATAKNIGGRKYVQVEGWQAIALAHGCVASSGQVERIDGGVRAIGRITNMATGSDISTAEGFVGDDEKTWANRAEYAKRAMAQTRAISRACRSAFAHVVVMMNAGLQTTPAEEVPEEGFHDQQKQTGVIDVEAEDTPEVAEKKRLAKEAEEYVKEIGLCDTDEKLELVVRRYVKTMTGLVAHLPKWHERMTQILNEKRASFEKKEPQQEAAE